MYYVLQTLAQKYSDTFHFKKKRTFYFYYIAISCDVNDIIIIPIGIIIQ